MGNSTAGTAAKLLTLVPILAAVYFYDLTGFFDLLTSLKQGALLAVAISLFVFGAVLKRRVLRTRLELASTSLAWGLIFLALAAGLYVFGSYTAAPIWYHYESLLALITAYVAFRMGASVLRSLAPLLAILALALPLSLVPAVPASLLALAPGLSGETTLTVFVFASAALILALMSLYVRFRGRPMVFPLAVVFAGVAVWVEASSHAGLSAEFLLLIPAPLLVLFVPHVFRFVSLSRGSPAAGCGEHRLLPDGFCSICGSKVVRARRGENVGVWGLIAVVVVAALLIVTSVPVLVMVGGVPQSAVYTPRGFTDTIIPATPSGWQVNSTAVYENSTVTSPNFTPDAYAIQQVFVPVYHPEVSNYTVSFELSPVPVRPYSNISSAYASIISGEIPGWSQFADNLTTLGPFQGYLTGYVGPNGTVLMFQGQAPMSFLSGDQAQQYNVGVGFVTLFKNSNASADTTRFLADLDAFWISGFNTDNSNSGYTSFLYTLYLEATPTVPLVLLLSSIAAMGWVAYRVSFYDDRLDRFLTLAASQQGEGWRELSGLLGLSRHSGTGREVGAAEGDHGPTSAETLDSTLRSLEKKHLVRRSIVERGADAVSVWRTVD